LHAGVTDTAPPAPEEVLELDVELEDVELEELDVELDDVELDVELEDVEVEPPVEELTVACAPVVGPLPPIPPPAPVPTWLPAHAAHGRATPTTTETTIHEVFERMGLDRALPPAHRQHPLRATGKKRRARVLWAQPPTKGRARESRGHGVVPHGA
jgi:hypothetical protein